MRMESATRLGGPEAKGPAHTLRLLPSAPKFSYFLEGGGRRKPAPSQHASVMSNSLPPWTVARHAPLSMRFSRQEYWSGLPSPPPGDPKPWKSPKLQQQRGKGVRNYSAFKEFRAGGRGLTRKLVSSSCELWEMNGGQIGECRGSPGRPRQAPLGAMSP